ncbi:MAG: alpha/beta hydrolase [Planctomycetota bacterium]
MKAFSPILLAMMATVIHAQSPSLLPATIGPEADFVSSVWPGGAPEWTVPDGEEHDSSKPDSRKQGSRSVVRLTNVRDVELHCFVPSSPKSDSVVVIAPGGGFSILAWDLEGTEIAQWFKDLGIRAAVLKYRVPTRSEEEKWLAPVQDIQRAISMIHKGEVDGMKSDSVGVLGFSAGGHAAFRAAVAPKAFYETAPDTMHRRPEFCVLVYPAWLNQEGTTDLLDEIPVADELPSLFVAHATDDRVSCQSGIAAFETVRKSGSHAEMHLFASGGHGFGGRLSGIGSDSWRSLAEKWMELEGILD